MSAITIQLNHNRDYERFFYDKAKYVAISGGRRTGKTWEARNWMLESLLDGYGQSGLWFDTVQGNIEKYVQRYFKPVLKPIWDNLVHWDRQKQILHLPRENYLDFASAQKPENAEGFAYDYHVINEAGIVFKKPEIWQNTIQPMTKDSKGVRFVGTPKGRNTFWDIYQKGIQLYPNYRSFTLSAWNSIYWKKEMLQQIKDSTPVHIFKQEYEGEFIEGEGSVFLGLDNCIVPINLLPRGIVGERYVMGVDLAKHTDFTVITIADMKSEIVYFERFNQLDWTFQKQKIYSIWENFNRPQVYIDSTGVGDPIYDDLCHSNMQGKLNGYKFTNASKKDLIENLIVCISNQTIKIPNITELVNELQTFEYNMTRSGLISYNAPLGLHDDCVASLGLTMWGLKNPANNFAFAFNG